MDASLNRWCRQRIRNYAGEVAIFELYARIMKAMLERAKYPAVPEAVVQVRAKNMSSYAEKIIRKAKKYRQESRGPTDLCGARIIVQTLEQVKAVRRFVEANFTVIEEDDKVLSLDDDRFGYRDMHYIVRLPDHKIPGVSEANRRKIGDRKAEIQVRTWVQHAWADTLHDRLYKAALKPSAELRRAGALLAALMEDGDRNFDQLAGEIDGMVANYTAHASRAQVREEIKVQEFILKNELKAVRVAKKGKERPDLDRAPMLALRLSRLIANSEGKFERSVELLEPHVNSPSYLRAEVQLELGYALCRIHKNDRLRRQYQRGQTLMERAAKLFGDDRVAAVPRTRKNRSLGARAHSWLGWSWESDPTRVRAALGHYQQALELEPDNPYHLAEVLTFEVLCKITAKLPTSTCIAVRSAVETCRDHVVAGIEMPAAAFTAGRLCMLLGVDRESERRAAAYDAIYWYARGLRHCQKTARPIVMTVLDRELDLLPRLYGVDDPPPECRWVCDLLELTRKNLDCLCQDDPEKDEDLDALEPSPLPSTIIISGGAESLTRRQGNRFEPALINALETFTGTVISGGTVSGVPGRVGAAAAALKASRSKGFHLVGYIPTNLPADGPKDRRYDDYVTCEEPEFSPEQVIRCWSDLIEKGVKPEEVQLLGFGGGPLSRVESCIALAMNATTGLVIGSGGAATELLDDPVWSSDPRLFPLPDDDPSLRAFVHLPDGSLATKDLHKMGESLHERYLEDSQGRMPENLRPWSHLNADYRRSNLEQARYSVAILCAAGCVVRKPKGKPRILKFDRDRDAELLTLLAELEHGRWNIQRLHAGWRPGTVRDDVRKIHDMIVPWKGVPKKIREYDYEAVMEFPKLLAEVGLEVRRPRRKPGARKR